MSFLFYFLTFSFIGLSIFLCFIILIQESKSFGLGASFGSDSSGSVFGTSTADVLKKMTTWLAVIFFITCLLLSVWAKSMSQNTMIQKSTIEQVQ